MVRSGGRRAGHHRLAEWGGYGPRRPLRRRHAEVGEGVDGGFLKPRLTIIPDVPGAPVHI